EVRPAPLVLGRKAQTEDHVDQGIDNGACNERIGGTQHATDELGEEAYPAHAAEHGLTEDSAGDTAPQPAQPMQGPDAQHVVELPLRTGDSPEAADEEDAGH